MASVPPPQGMSEVDYEAIEAAVTETVRGRWFLSEFARRNRLAETRQLLDAMSRIEAAVAGGQTALPSADPSIRLLIQRIKEIAAGLDTVADDMRQAGVAAHFVEAVESQGRAVSGMMRSATPSVSSPSAVGRLPPSAVSLPAAKTEPSPPPRMPKAELPPSLAGSHAATAAVASGKAGQPQATPVGQAKPAPVWPPAAVPADDPRLAPLSAFDDLPLAKKLALFG